MILLQQNHEFELCGAILSQNLVAGERHVDLVLLVVKCCQCVSDHATFNWKTIVLIYTFLAFFNVVL